MKNIVIRRLSNKSNVCFGCDGEASSSSRDMIREARNGAYLHKAVTLNPSVMDLSTTYKMLTRNGANALHYNDCGSITEGKKADFILIDTNNDVSLTNQQQRLSNLLYAGTGYSVDTVFINGNMVLQGKQFTKLNQADILDKCEKLLNRIDEEIIKG